MLTTIIACLCALCFSFIALFRKGSSTKVSEGYILHNQVTHARLLPAESKHAFTYPTLSLLVSLDALERKKLDLLGGVLFGYGGLWGRIVGLRPDSYLSPGSESIRLKLERVLSRHGLPQDQLDQAWMMTTPSYLGFEGINPLTVYFCYKPESVFWLTVLEVHNTFGESHVYVLEVGHSEDPKPDTEPYTNQWTFRRSFHVSPFNDRSGFYRVSINQPSHAPSQGPTVPPLPSVRVHLHLDNPFDPEGAGDLKITALLRPISATLLSTKSLFLALLSAPFGLFLAMPRILYQAGILHYRKKLDVYIRPAPKPALGFPSAGGVKWLTEGVFEKYAKELNVAFLRQRVEDLGVAVKLVSGDPSMPPIIIAPRKGYAKDTLQIVYLSSKFFTILLSAPSAAHALLMGIYSEGIVTTSSEALFLLVYGTVSSHTTVLSRRQRLRSWPVPASIGLPIPSEHPLDLVSSPLVMFSVLWILQAMDDIEAYVFRLLRARLVAGNEPWYRKQWERVAYADKRPIYHPCGSVRRE